MKRLLWINTLALILIAAIMPVNSVNAQNVITTNGVAPSGPCPVNGDWSFSGDGKITECYANTWTTFSSGTVSSNSTVVAASSPLAVTNSTAGNTTTYTVAPIGTTGNGTTLVLATNATLSNATLSNPTVYPLANSTVSPIPSVFTALPLASNTLAPSHYNMLQPTLYYNPLQVGNCTTATNVSNSTVYSGLTATTNGTTGTCTINLPQPIDPTVPGSLIISFTLAEAASNTTTIAFENPLSPTTTGLRWITGANGGNSIQGILTTTGSLSNITVGTPMILTVDWDGTRFYQSIFPAAGALTTVNTDMSYNANWDGSQYTGAEGAQYADPTYGAQFTNLSQISITSTSAANTINGIKLCQGFICGDNDGLFPTPGFMQPGTGLNALSSNNATSGPCRVALNCTGNEIFIPYTYGNPNGNHILQVDHPNDYPNLESVAYTTVAAYLNAGWLVLSEEYGGSNAQSAIPSGWGNYPSALQRKKQLDYSRAYLPNGSDVSRFGMSMGCLNALDDEWYFPGAKSIVCVSGASGLYQSFTQTTPWSTTGAGIIETAYGPLYSAVANSTNQNPATATTYWQNISNGTVYAGEGYFTSPAFTFQNQWSNSTAYTPTNIVNLPLSGWQSWMNAYDPYQNPTRFINTPIYLSYCPLDTTLNPAQDTNFASVVNAAGGNVTLNASSNGSCNHLTADQFLPSTFVAFSNSYVSNYSTNQFGTPPAVPVAPAYPSFDARAPVTHHLAAAYAHPSGSFGSVPNFSWPIAAGQSELISCHLIYQCGWYEALYTQLTGPTPTQASAGGMVQTGTIAGVSTIQAVRTANAAALPELTPVAGLQNASTNYEADEWFQVTNGNTAGTLQLQIGSPTTDTNTLAIGSSCTMTPQ